MFVEYDSATMSGITLVPIFKDFCFYFFGEKELKQLKKLIMGLFGNLLKGVVNVAISPLDVVTDVVKGDFDNTSKVVENIVDSVGDGVDDLMNGDLI